VIAKAFIIAKDNCRISAKIIRANKILGDHGAFAEGTTVRSVQSL